MKFCETRTRKTVTINFILGLLILGMGLVPVSGSWAATLPGVGPSGGSGGGSDGDCIDILTDAQLQCDSSCSLGIGCCNDADLALCYEGAQSAYWDCEDNGFSGYPFPGWGFSGSVDPCPFDDNLDGFAYVDLTTGTQMQICWQDSNSFPVYPPTTVQSVDIYATTSASFWGQWAADSTISSIDFDLIGSATADPLPDTGAEDKFATCWGWSMDLDPSYFVADTGYQLAAVIRDLAIPADSLKVITTTMFVTNSPASAVGNEGLGNRPGTPQIDILAAVPNPFNPSLEVAFATKESADLALEIYDVSGHLVRSFGLGTLAPGQHRARWNGRDRAGRDVSSGVYFARIAGTADQSAMKKIVLVR